MEDEDEEDPGGRDTDTWRSVSQCLASAGLTHQVLHSQVVVDESVSVSKSEMRVFEELRPSCNIIFIYQNSILCNFNFFSLMSSDIVVILSALF